MAAQHSKRKYPLGTPGVCSRDDPAHVRSILQSTRDVLFDAHRAIQDNQTYTTDEEDEQLLEITERILQQHVFGLLSAHDLRSIQGVFPQAAQYVLSPDEKHPHSPRIVKHCLWHAACGLGDLLKRLRENEQTPQAIYRESGYSRDSIQGRFTFEPNIARFDGIDLELAPKPVKMLRKLVDNFGRLVPYTDFDMYYTSAAPGTVLKDKMAIVRAFKKFRIPCEIRARTGQGYIMRCSNST